MTDTDAIQALRHHLDELMKLTQALAEHVESLANDRKTISTAMNVRQIGRLIGNLRDSLP